MPAHGFIEIGLFAEESLSTGSDEPAEAAHDQQDDGFPDFAVIAVIALRKRRDQRAGVGMLDCGRWR
ncbi:MULTISPECIES: hypothetical protein [unclassified Chelatococcus]|uniref:hypothetical protein n=1 Tax=unclassified Chelatococcus TaxID=2638111 RepID=UPI001BCF8B47|nr:MULTISPECIES: hypothetical protein [unclassified Chelatococcus]CAH1652261.1 hypothetical protein CHELA20_10794 [Hyphomicrobiales bacterium]MBS7743056.1 hypothetical protein [Chelatococcus sp. HY11]MBX3541826.1 hypothetical protein [Chelatococcus sp.]MCO5074283.1 hypothetical protein [Chelatococcus sp.]CAH1693746.1 hypothetical protein CHELA41_51024 [Hyphomicrobiales bacterium]